MFLGIPIDFAARGKKKTRMLPYGKFGEIVCTDTIGGRGINRMGGNVVDACWTRQIINLCNSLAFELTINRGVTDIVLKKAKSFF